jgi:hypothetical protein
VEAFFVREEEVVLAMQLWELVLEAKGESREFGDPSPGRSWGPEGLAELLACFPGGLLLRCCQLEDVAV